MYQLFLTGAAGDEPAHNAADHVQIDIQHNLVKIFLVALAVGLGAQQPPLLAAAEDETQTVPVGLFGESLRHGKQPDGAGHIVISALRKGSGVIVSGQDDILRYLARQIQNHIVGIFLGLGLLQLDFSHFCPVLYQQNGILGVDIHTGKKISLGNIASQLPLVNVPVSIVGVAVIGHKAHSALFQNVLIGPVPQIAVHQHNLPPAAGKALGGGIPQVIKGCLHLSRAGAQIPLAGNLLPIRQENGFFYRSHVHSKGLNHRFAPKPLTLPGDILRSPQLLRAASGAHISGLLKNPHNILLVHGNLLLFYLKGIISQNAPKEKLRSRSFEAFSVIF